VFLLITGASGTGKSSVRAALAPELGPEVVCVELGDVVPIPARPMLAWRQESTEAVVRLALEYQAEGRHLLLSGDPVAPGEVLAAPSASHLPEVLTTNAWEEMRWERWVDRRGDDPGWNVATIDTTPLDLDEVAAEVLAWVRASLRGETAPLELSAGGTS
jgi:hypothetical protein